MKFKIGNYVKIVNLLDGSLSPRIRKIIDVDISCSRYYLNPMGSGSSSATEGRLRSVGNIELAKFRVQNENSKSR